MAHAWWRDSDYELFYRLERERNEARAKVERLREALRDVAERQREACEEVAAVYDGTPELVAMVRATPLVTEEEP